MKKYFEICLSGLVLAIFLSACGGGGGGGDNIQNVVVDDSAYYIDAVNGNDGNDGKTPQQAWKTLNNINNTTINAGNKILFRVGQKWQGQLNIKNSGTAENPITIGSYGEGAKPIISALNIVKIDKWYPYNGVGDNGLGAEFKEDVSDPANTWLAVILDDHPYRIKINSQEVLGAFDSLELSDTFKWSYNRDKDGTVFYYYGNDKPSQIETSVFTSPLYIHDCQNIVVENIELEGGFVAGIFIDNANDITIQKVTVGDMSKQGIYVNAKNKTVKNIKIDSCIIDSKYTLDYSMAVPNLERNGRTSTTRGAPEGIMFWGGIQNSVISNNTIKNWTHANINFSADFDEELSNNKVFNNDLSAPDIAYGGRIGVDGKNNHDNKFYNNRVHDIKAPIQFNGHDNEFSGNVVEDVKVSILKPDETGYGVVLQGYASAVYNNKIINNTFRRIAKDAILISNNNTYEVKNNTITPNTIE